MARRKPKTTGYTRSSLLNALPWWLSACAGMLLAAFFWLFAVDLHLPGAGRDAVVASIDTALHAPLALGAAGWLSLGFGGVMALLSWRRQQCRKQLLQRQRSLDTVKAMSWQEFEQLVGECYRRHGYRVSETGQGGADGGIDLVLHKKGKKIVVQCKQWKTTSIGAPIVREMFGLMMHHSADRVKIVCCGKFTKEALAFAKGKPIDLVDGVTLVQMLIAVQR